MQKNKKRVYVGLAADILHEGHINILKIASKLGDVTVGLLTDSAISSYKNLPHLDYKQREVVLKNIKFVKKVLPQDTLDYTKNLIHLKPHYVVHGDDWKFGIQKKTRKQVINTLKRWAGKLIEPKYTKNISSTQIKNKMIEIGSSPENRRSRLKRLINSKKIVRIIESHNAFTGLIVENLKLVKNQKFLEFDGMWSSSLTDSAIRGKPDNQAVDYSTRIAGLNEMLDVTTKPVIFDADNGGRIEHISYLVKTLERVGISAIVIEDKIGLKKNSLFKNQEGVKQDSIENFCAKLKKAKESKISDDLFIIARIESFILGKSLKDAIRRAEAYSRAGADAILIHSKEKKPNQIFSFSKNFLKSKFIKPLIAVPSTYSKTYEHELIDNGFKIVIYANHFLRAIHPAMLNVAKMILKNTRSYETEKKISSINEVINII
jgi:phosphoenolpyruvate phosphomutase|tara:strand:- start:206 stop:1504 length:1299 start_codon:yes stop_codon:yes gene_type:complete